MDAMKAKFDEFLNYMRELFSKQIVNERTVQAQDDATTTKKEHAE